MEGYFRQFFEGKLNILRNEFPNPQVIVSEGGDLAVLHYNLRNIVGDGQGGEKAGTPWNSTQVYRLIGGQWRVVHVHWSFTRHPAALQGLMSCASSTPPHRTGAHDDPPRHRQDLHQGRTDRRPGHPGQRHLARRGVAPARQQPVLGYTPGHGDGGPHAGQVTRADHYMVNGDWVAITLEFAGVANGIQLRQPGVDLIRIEGGKIVEVRLFSSNQEEEDAFWGR